MNLDILGDLERNGDSATCKVDYLGATVGFHISRDGDSMDSVLGFAVSVAEAINSLDLSAKTIACRDLLGKYNGGWNEYDEIQKDGTTKTVINPTLDDQEFISNLSLSSITITGDASITMFYNDSNMFWGHSVIVSSFDGLALDNATAQLFG